MRCLYHQFVRDLPYALCGVNQNRLSLITILSLGLAGAANTAVFSFLNAVLLRELPVEGAILSAILILIAVAGVAGSVPAYRAFASEPLKALHYE